MRSWGYHFKARVGASFVVCSERLTFGDVILKWKKSQIFSLFSSQNSDLDNEQVDEIGQKAQAKNTKRAAE